MFDFLLDAGNYADRMVDRNEYDWGFISTARCSDGSQPFETAVQHDKYADEDGETDNMIIVESYDNTEEAQAGHDKWVEIMTNKPPSKLMDCQNAGIGKLCGAFGDIIQTRIDS